MMSDFKSENAMAQNRRLCLFDFDGTLTRSDSLLCLLSYCGGRGRLLWRLLLRSPQLVLMKLGLWSNHKLKQELFATYFQGMLLSDFDALCRRFARSHQHILRSQGVDALRQALEQGADVAVVSASIDNWVRPFFWLALEGLEPEVLSRLRVLGTQVEVLGGRLTGRFATPNCYGQEKVRRIREAFPDVEGRPTVAYGDSRGDREMLRLAGESHYKPFK